MSFLTKLYESMESEKSRHKTQLAFLPAAIEIQETPPSPIGRMIVWTILTLFVLAGIWAYYGEIDIVAIAPGKVIPSDRVKVIQPLEIGIVETIHISEGQRVDQGEALITLDSTQTEADERRMVAELQMAELEAVRQDSFARYLKNKEDNPVIEWPADISPSRKRMQERLLAEHVNEFNAALQTLDNQVIQSEAEERAAQSQIVKLEKTLPIIRQRAQRLATLLEQSMVSESEYLELEQQRIEAVQDLVNIQARVEGVQASLDVLMTRQRTLRAETLKNSLGDLQESQRRISILEQELIKASQRNSQQILYAPIDGVVTDLSVFTVGGVVTPAEKLMNIVPANSELEVEAFVLNKDIGFVSEGDVAEVKIDTFNFTKYGVIKAQIVDLSNDARSDEMLGLVYMAKVSIEDKQLLVNNKWVNLSPGMSVTVEIKIGTRRIIEFFLSPLLRYRDESIRER